MECALCASTLTRWGNTAFTSEEFIVYSTAEDDFVERELVQTLNHLMKHHKNSFNDWY